MSDSLLKQAEKIALDQPEGITAGVIVKDGKASAELSANVDVGKKGGWRLGAVARAGNERFAAILAKWTPKD